MHRYSADNRRVKGRFPPAVVYVIAMSARRLVFLVLVGVVAALTPAALASPPDQTWIPGVYDNADYDDAVLAVTAAVASCEPAAPNHPRVERLLVAVVSPSDDDLARPLPLVARHTRAPPTS
jgi:hypothetical protein